MISLMEKNVPNKTAVFLQNRTNTKCITGHEKIWNHSLFQLFLLFFLNSLSHSLKCLLSKTKCVSAHVISIEKHCPNIKLMLNIALNIITSLILNGNNITILLEINLWGQIYEIHLNSFITFKLLLKNLSPYILIYLENLSTDMIWTLISFWGTITLVDFSGCYESCLVDL